MKLTTPLSERILTRKYINSEIQSERELHQIYVNKVSSNTFKMIYFIIITTIGHTIVRQTNFLPATLLGNGDFGNLFDKNHPTLMFFEKPAYFDIYYCSCLSYHLVESIYLFLTETNQTDFVMMLLHHLCTVSLIVFSYCSNNSNVGAIVLLLHDASDIFVYVTRIAINTKYSSIVRVPPGVFMLVIYIYLRLYVFGTLLVTIYVSCVGAWNMLTFPMFMFLCFLYTLHLYWTFLIVKKLFLFISQNEIEDVYKVKTR